MTTVVAAPSPHSIPHDAGLSSLAHLAASAPPMVTNTSRASPSGNSHSARTSPKSATRPVVEEEASPKSARTVIPPMIKVKKEPSSPNPASSRHRPRRLDLSNGTASRPGPQSARPSAPLTAKDSAGLAIHDLGVACLSPGFQTQDPAMREQLQRSLDVREQQRQIIEARNKGSAKPSGSHDPSEAPQRIPDGAQFGQPPQAPQTSRRKGPPPGLSISAPSAAAFSNERVIQSAPLHQSFTGLRQHPYSHQPSALGQTSHIHHVPATQTANRLPPISDVFAHDSLAAPPSASMRPGGLGPGQSPSHGAPPMQSPSFPPPSHSQAPSSARAREFKSAEEAVQEMSRGREDLLPKIVHYGGVQPPTPPSPNHHHQQQPYPPNAYPQPPHPAAPGYADYPRQEYADHHRQEYAHPAAGRRRTRDEYERDEHEPMRHPENKRTSFAAREEEDWRAGMNSQEKREEFMRLCARAWDLFHS